MRREDFDWVHFEGLRLKLEVRINV